MHLVVVVYTYSQWQGSAHFEETMLVAPEYKVRDSPEINKLEKEKIMKSKILYCVIPAVLLSISASKTWAEDTAGPADADTSAPVDCSTAKDDISTLQHEKEKTSDKAVGGIFAFTPIGLVANVATGGDKMDKDQKLSAEEYNKAIDERIAQIKAACADSLSSGDDTE